MNEALLQQIAGATGGFYLPLRGANTMDTLYERGLAPLPKSEGKERLVRRYHEQFHWPLAAAMLLLLAELFLPERKRERQSPNSLRRLQETEQSMPGLRRYWLVVLLALLILPGAIRLRRRARCANTNRVITRTRCRNLSGWPK